jgi:hypothetical protein
VAILFQLRISKFKIIQMKYNEKFSFSHTISRAKQTIWLVAVILESIDLEHSTRKVLVDSTVLDNRSISTMRAE